MSDMRQIPPILAHFLPGWEIVLLLAVLLILFGARKLPEMARNLGSLLDRPTLLDRLLDWLRKGPDQEAHDAGKSVGGIYGKPAAQALTHDNQTAEFYYVPESNDQSRESRRARHRWLQGLANLWRRICGIVAKLLHR